MSCDELRKDDVAKSGELLQVAHEVRLADRHRCRELFPQPRIGLDPKEVITQVVRA